MPSGIGARIHSGHRDDADFVVGGRYAVRSVTHLFLSPAFDEPATQLVAKEVVLLISIQEDIPACRGLVAPKPPHFPGWLSLDADTLYKRRLEGSWVVGGRYALQHGALLREGTSLNSALITEIHPFVEVTILELGLNGDVATRQPLRLRARVSLADNTVGWMSPETSDGFRLLNSVNLLSEARPRQRFGQLSHFVSRWRNSSTGDPSENMKDDADSTPWEVGGQYRVLKALVLRQDAKLRSKEVSKVKAGSLVTIKELSFSEEAGLGWCPTALVTVDGERGQQGWLPCLDKNGTYLLDPRNQLHFDKIVDRLRQEEHTPQSAVRVVGTEFCMPVDDEGSSSGEADVNESVDESVVACSETSQTDAVKPLLMEPSHPPEPARILSLEDRAVVEDEGFGCCSLSCSPSKREHLWGF